MPLPIIMILLLSPVKGRTILTASYLIPRNDNPTIRAPSLPACKLRLAIRKTPDMAALRGARYGNGNTAYPPAASTHPSRLPSADKTPW